MDSFVFLWDTLDSRSRTKRILQHRPQAAPGRPSPCSSMRFSTFPGFPHGPTGTSNAYINVSQGFLWIPLGDSRFPEQSNGKWKKRILQHRHRSAPGTPLCSSMRFSTFHGFPRGPMVPPGNPKPGNRTRKLEKRILQHCPRAAPGRPAPMFQHLLFHFPRSPTADARACPNGQQATVSNLGDASARPEAPRLHQLRHLERNRPRPGRQNGPLQRQTEQAGKASTQPRNAKDSKGQHGVSRLDPRSAHRHCLARFARAHGMSRISRIRHTQRRPRLRTHSMLDYAWGFENRSHVGKKDNLSSAVQCCAAMCDAS